MKIIIDDLNGSEIADLLNEHLQDMKQSTPGTVHALDLSALQKPEITFWSAWENKDLLGCGALKELNKNHAEIKSMRTSSAHRRKGVARKILQHILIEAKQAGYQQVSLETSHTFKPALQLYSRFGFTSSEPFANYTDDPNSVFMTMKI